MKKIGLLIDTLIGGGAEKFTLTFASTFAKLGHDVHIFILEDKIEHDVDTNLYSIHNITNNIKLYDNKYLKKQQLVKLLKQKIKLLEENVKFDLFISNSEDMDYLGGKAKLDNFFIRYRNSMYQYFQSKLGKTSGFKRIRREFKFKQQFKKRYDNQNIITVSKALIDDITIQMNIKPKSIDTIYNPLDFDRIKSLSKEMPLDLPDTKYIICVAKYENRKDQITLLKAYAESKVFDVYKLLLVGGTYTESDKDYLKLIKQTINKLSLNKYVNLMDFKQNPYPYIKNAELLVLPSKSEGFGAVLAEALILKTKIISTDCPCGPSEILKNELSSFLSPVGDHMKMSDNIKKALISYPVITDEIVKDYDPIYSVSQYLELVKK
ncbi:glycosyltransferase [Poseidonibacter lekithochrous]|uniref:glycosyltransferase n=1 Tax=Poseidonibacter lekithochrous TaxID=1904463 RepID=UPI000D369972|nr:glycosyltransferase [Poseidonibacter lekithochrous]